MTQAAAVRRTQAERSAATVAALVDATIETIADLGYHRASLGEICTRAGVSKGGLFRHFDSRLDLVVAAAGEVGRRHLDGFRSLGDAPVGELLAFARSRARARINAVWFELLIAARTDTALREHLTPVAIWLYDSIEELALASTPAGDVDPELVRLAATSVVHMFDGEAVIRSVLPRPELEEARLAGVVAWFAETAGASRA
ncbi:MAG: TetR family transcriptional regulator [Marmoricola sp.]|nr:TetR family transcriptional regulator [Marmoricola sp.]